MGHMEGMASGKERENGKEGAERKEKEAGSSV